MQIGLSPRDEIAFRYRIGRAFRAQPEQCLKDMILLIMSVLGWDLHAEGTLFVSSQVLVRKLDNEAASVTETNLRIHLGTGHVDMTMSIKTYENDERRRVVSFDAEETEVSLKDSDSYMSLLDAFFTAVKKKAA